MMVDSSHRRLQARIRTNQRRIARGERPAYHVTWRTPPDCAADLAVLELPIIHLFVATRPGVPDAARGLIAGTLLVDPASFDLVIQEPPAVWDPSIS